jgi:PPE-repeat protein
MSYPVLPPEVNSARMHGGAGSGPMLAAATAWTGLANELRTAASSFASVTSGLSGQGGTWQGPSAAAMAAVAAPYTAWLSTAASHSERAASQATAVATAYEAAHAATVPPQLVSINRAVTATLANTNLLGLNSPAIAQKEAEYAEMWAQDVTAMGGYHAGASAAWSQLAPVAQLLQRLCRPGKLPPVLPTAPVPVRPPRALSELW